MKQQEKTSQREQTKPLIVSRSELLAMVGLSYPTIFRMMRAGRFPRPLQLSAKRVGWKYSEVEAYLQARTEERDAKNGEKAA